MRIVIAEDQVLLREGLVRLFLGRGHDVAAAVGDAEALRSGHQRNLSGAGRTAAADGPGSPATATRAMAPHQSASGAGALQTCADT